MPYVGLKQSQTAGCRTYTILNCQRLKAHRSVTASNCQRSDPQICVHVELPEVRPTDL